MNSDLEQLKALVLEGGWDTESRQLIIDFEKKLHDVAVREKLADREPIKSYVQWLTDRINQAELLLKSDRTLTDRQRDSLFERIDDCDYILALFGRGTAKAGIESAIKEALARAKAS